MSSASSLCGQILPDGSTTTTVTVSPSGAVTVGIAPATSNGVSLNHYHDFNVSSAGVVLDNQIAAARTIVNEVTSSTVSHLNGPLEVAGQTAHVIIANPNGIVIDGGRFINTGRVALTTGAISTSSRQIAPGIYRDNVVATVNGGVISVEGGGLSGQMDAVDLIAHEVKVAAPITNDAESPDARIGIFAGNSRTEFESSVLPGNTSLTWGSTVGSGETADGSIFVDILRPGVLRANHIVIEINAAGAGARIAGEGYANSREFSLTSHGAIEVLGARLSGAAGLQLAGTAVSVKDSQLSASSGALSLSASASGGDGLAVSSSHLTSQSLALSSAANIALDQLTATTTGTDASTGYAVINAAGAISYTKGSMTAAQSLIYTSGTKLSFDQTAQSSAQSVTVSAVNALEVKSSQISGFGHMLVAAGTLDVTSDATQSELVAQNGSLVVSTTGDLTNEGGLLQGGTKVAEVANTAGTKAQGAVTLDVAGSFHNGNSAAFVGAILGAAGDVVITAGQNVLNTRGRILANGDMQIEAGGGLSNLVDFANGASDPIITEHVTNGQLQWWTLWTKRRRETSLSYDFGTLADPDRLASIGATGSVTLTANALLNQGGQIYANAGDVTLTAKTVETIGVGSGKIEVSKICVLTCGYDASGEVAVYGGQISAGTDLVINATDLFNNKGGTTVAAKDVTITADQVVLEAMAIPSLVWRPAGLYNFWRSKAAWIYLRDQFGSLVADTGHITVFSPNAVKVIGGEISAKTGTTLQSGEDIVRAPDIVSDALGHEIGLLHDLPLLRK